MSGPNRVLGSVSDMMAGLMIVFLFLLVCYMARTQGTTNDILTARNRIDYLEKELDQIQKQKEQKEIELDQQIQKKEIEKTKIQAMLEDQKIDLQKSYLENEKAQRKARETEAELDKITKEKSEIDKRMEKIQQDSLKYFQTQTAIAKALKTEFQNDLLTWGASVEPDGTVRFYNPSVLFKQNEDKLTPEGAKMLKEFFVRYIKILYSPKFMDHLGEIRVEGHTSSEWADGVTENQRYIWNLDLSQRRAFEILRICLPTIEDPQTLERVKAQATATGHSSSKIVRNQDFTENRELSRRVEFKAITQSEKVLREISGLEPMEP